MGLPRSRAGLGETRVWGTVAPGCGTGVPAELRGPQEQGGGSRAGPGGCGAPAEGVAQGKPGYPWGEVPSPPRQGSRALRPYLSPARPRRGASPVAMETEAGRPRSGPAQLERIGGSEPGRGRGALGVRTRGSAPGGPQLGVRTRAERQRVYVQQRHGNPPAGGCPALPQSPCAANRQRPSQKVRIC